MLPGKAQVSDSLSVKLLQCEKDYWTANTDSVRFAALIKKAEAYRNVAHYEESLHELYRASKYAVGKKEEAIEKYEEMTDYFLNNQYSFCGNIIIDSIQGTDFYKGYETMKLFSLIETENWETCKQEMLKLCKPADTSVIDALPVGYNYKSPEKARRMSAYLPGLGEVYAGYPFKGATSFVLNAGFLCFMAYNISTGYYVMSVVSGFYPFLKFYNGGKRLSAILTERHNQKEAEVVKNKYRAEANLLLQ